MPVVQSHPASSKDAPHQYKQPSRKGKKTWRKNVNVSDVQEGLADLNEEVIRGGVIKEKASSDLFTLDVRGDADIRKKYPKKGLKADEILAQRSAVPAVSARKRAGEKITDGLLPAKRQRTDWVSHKELARLKKVADGDHEATIEAKDATYDVWDNPSAANGTTATTEAYDFLPEKAPVKAPTSMKQKPVSLAASGKSIPAVLKPSGGYSYNPVFTDYQERLAAESEKALDAERKRFEAAEADRLRQEAAARSGAAVDAAEARADLSEWEEDSEWEGFQSGVEDEKPGTKPPQRKTQAQRNRIKRRKEEERLARHKANMRARAIQEQRIKDIAAEVAARDQQRQLRLRDDDDGDEETNDENLRRRQLGNTKLPDKNLELVLPDELQESLRLLKPEGDLLKERYRSMLVRGKIESRKRIPFKKQAKRKVTEKWTHKDFVI